MIRHLHLFYVGASADCEFGWVDFNFDVPPSAHIVSTKVLGDIAR